MLLISGSDEGKRCREEAEALKKKGNDALNDKNYPVAVMLYSEAVNVTLLAVLTNVELYFM